MTTASALREHMRECSAYRKETRASISALGAEMREAVSKTCETHARQHDENRKAMEEISDKVYGVKMWAMSGVISTLLGALGFLLHYLGTKGVL